MTHKNEAWQALRPALFLIAGVLPALLMALVVQFFAPNDIKHGYGPFTTVIPWVGAAGLILAIFYQPSRIGWCLRGLITVLLMFGLSLILPQVIGFAIVLYFSVVDPGVHVLILLVLLMILLGPTLLALQYCWQVVRVSSVRQRCLLGLVAIAIMWPVGYGFYLNN
ncbi:hypothetical protein [Halopseudomonas salegens]|uniref:Uncharacterized protein n=1 Tax=Halopseudomonas salegens TaxID=1434072 RepID=A0A1H2FFW2_9GAMM|nr:hypothetical protein [Halopseudomonas salegens]SDU06163.1 hypothetical protein SAMN05216210_1524 [Halopseudomonas salegens]